MPENQLTAFTRLDLIRISWWWVEGDERAKLEDLARRLGIREKVTFFGLVRDMTPVYATINVLIHASGTEATPRVVLEAMAHRIPVIATAVGDVPVLLEYGRAGVLVPPNDADALGAAAIEVIESPLRVQSLISQQGLRALQGPAYRRANALSGGGGL